MPSSNTVKFFCARPVTNLSWLSVTMTLSDTRSTPLRKVPSVPCAYIPTQHSRYAVTTKSTFIGFPPSSSPRVRCACRTRVQSMFLLDCEQNAGRYCGGVGCAPHDRARTYAHFLGHDVLPLRIPCDFNRAFRIERQRRCRLPRTPTVGRDRCAHPASRRRADSCVGDSAFARVPCSDTRWPELLAGKSRVDARDLCT